MKDKMRNSVKIVWLVINKPRIKKTLFIVSVILLSLGIIGNILVSSFWNQTEPKIIQIEFELYFQHLVVPTWQQMSDGSFYFIVIGFSLLGFWILIIWKKSNRKQRVVIIQVSIMSVVIIVGLNTIFTGWGITQSYVGPRGGGSTDSLLIFRDNTIGNVTINYVSGYGVLPNNPIKTTVSLKIPEAQRNSSNVEIQFPKADVQTSEFDLSPYGGKITKLKFIPQYNGTYAAEPILTYQYPDKFDAIIDIVNNRTLQMAKQYNTNDSTIEFSISPAIVIDSPQQNIEQSQFHINYGFALIVVGISIFTVAPVIAQLIKLVDKYFISKQPDMSTSNG